MTENNEKLKEALLKHKEGHYIHSHKLPDKVFTNGEKISWRKVYGQKPYKRTTPKIKGKRAVKQYKRARQLARKIEQKRFSKEYIQPAIESLVNDRIAVSPFSNKEELDKDSNNEMNLSKTN